MPTMPRPTGPSPMCAWADPSLRAKRSNPEPLAAAPGLLRPPRFARGPRNDDDVVAACVDPKDAHQLWPHISHLIESAMRRGRLSDFAAVERAVLAGAQLLWL